MAWILQFLTWMLLINIEEIWTNAAVIPPPWANPKLNPCATKPRGWQLLYWPPDGKCYKIFQTGYPCPDDMELSPIVIKSNSQQFSSECRCPPKKAQSAKDGKCYDLYTKGPCEKGFYFAPDTYFNTSGRQWGSCLQIKLCPNNNQISWPLNGQCYQKLTKGPCPKGQLLVMNSDSKLGECKCNQQSELKDYYFLNDGNCYQHFTKGPCRENGQLFLPDRSCGCHSFLPHYHEETENCFEIGTIGPCGTGEVYQLHPETRRGICQCKSGYIRYENTTSCYRPYTQGPCNPHEILINSTTCISQPCQRGYLYFPKYDNCHRIGTRGPCRKGQIVTFDFETRPSIDGISHNGVCNCQKANCDYSDVIECKSGMILYQNSCYKLYTQGPCPKGAWLTPKRHKKEQFWFTNDGNRREGVCECVPGYIRTVRTINNITRTDCASPTVILADYLNKNFSIIS